MGPILIPETSDLNQPMLRNVPEDGRIKQQRKPAISSNCIIIIIISSSSSSSSSRRNRSIIAKGKGQIHHRTWHTGKGEEGLKV
jgi:hypothetical protein